MTGQSVLISGAGVAGPALAHLLSRKGFRPTLVELAAGYRSSGNPVDVRGPAVAVAERLGVLPRLREARTQARGMTFVSGSGRTIGRTELQPPNAHDVEIPRADLAAILTDAAREDSELIFADTITGLTQDPGGVDVTFRDSAPRRFDLVVGADGLHSAVRRLAFGPESQFAWYAGLYVATVQRETYTDDTWITLYNRPGKAVSVHPARGRPVAAFIFRSPALGEDLLHDPKEQKQVVRDAYAGQGWQVPELLDVVDASEDMYFDAVTEIRMDRWSIGRIGLLGDAASCISLFGEGSSQGLIGAAVLADALADTLDDPAAAFARYESRHRPPAGSRRNELRLGAAYLVPRTWPGLLFRNGTVRLRGLF